MSRKELEEQIAYCTTLGYLVTESVSTPDRVRVLDRVNEERLFLEGIANRTPKKSMGSESGDPGEQQRLPKQG
jgi:hypothetical protein